jgi:hypothetical protein
MLKESITLIDNKYSRWYYAIIGNAQARIDFQGYGERHHIVPRCLGGTNEKANIVKLTAKEHFVCHALLVRMTDSPKIRHKLVNAFVKMKSTNECHEGRYVNSRLFEAARIEFSNNQKDPVLDAERRLKISASHKLLPKKTLTAEWKLNIGKASTGKTHTEAYKNHMSNCKSEFWAKRKASGEGYPIRTCLCGISGRGPNMSRYHFDNCKKVMS